MVQVPEYSSISGIKLQQSRKQTTNARGMTMYVGTQHCKKIYHFNLVT